VTQPKESPVNPGRFKLNQLMSIEAAQPWFGKFDHASVVTPGLFRSLNRKSGQRQQHFCIEHILKPSNDRVRFESPELLGVDDLRVFQALVGLATQAGKPHRDARRRHEEREGGCSSEPIAARAYCTMAALARACGYSTRSGEMYNSVRASLRRLSRVTVLRRPPSDRTPATKEPFIRLAGMADAGDEMVDVGFNRALEKAILAVNKGEAYVKVNLDEARALKSDPARLLHHRLSFLNEGRSQRFKEETLETYVWPQASRADGANAAWNRRQVLSRALKDIKGRGWDVERRLLMVDIRRVQDERSNPGARRDRAKKIGKVFAAGEVDRQ
jgi:hypothetical protein